MLLNVVPGIAVCVAGAVIGELVIIHRVIRMPALPGGLIGGHETTPTGLLRVSNGL